MFCINGSLLYVSFIVLLIVFQEMEDKVISPEKVEEAKLKARYPHLGQKPGGSDFLRKRLQKGVSSLLSTGYGQEIPKFLYLRFLVFSLHGPLHEKEC